METLLTGSLCQLDNNIFYKFRYFHTTGSGPSRLITSWMATACSFERTILMLSFQIPTDSRLMLDQGWGAGNASDVLRIAAKITCKPTMVRHDLSFYCCDHPSSSSRDRGTARTAIQVHAVNLIKIRLGEKWQPISNQS